MAGMTTVFLHVYNDIIVHMFIDAFVICIHGDRRILCIFMYSIVKVYHTL